MRRGVTAVSPELMLDGLVNDHFLKHHYNSFPVIHGEELVGLMTLANVKKYHVLNGIGLQ